LLLVHIAVLEKHGIEYDSGYVFGGCAAPFGFAQGGLYGARLFWTVSPGLRPGQTSQRAYGAVRSRFRLLLGRLISLLVAEAARVAGIHLVQAELNLRLVGLQAKPCYLEAASRCAGYLTT
jgi:hypothetical protein